MSTITFGLYERYIDEALKKTPNEYAKKVKEFGKLTDVPEEGLKEIFDMINQ